MQNIFRATNINFNYKIVYNYIYNNLSLNIMQKLIVKYIIDYIICNKRNIHFDINIELLIYLYKKKQVMY